MVHPLSAAISRRSLIGRGVRLWSGSCPSSSGSTSTMVHQGGPQGTVETWARFPSSCSSPSPDPALGRAHLRTSSGARGDLGRALAWMVLQPHLGPVVMAKWREPWWSCSTAGVAGLASSRRATTFQLGGLAAARAGEQGVLRGRFRLRPTGVLPAVGVRPARSRPPVSRVLLRAVQPDAPSKLCDQRHHRCRFVIEGQMNIRQRVAPGRVRICDISPRFTPASSAHVRLAVLEGPRDRSLQATALPDQVVCAEMEERLGQGVDGVLRANGLRSASCRLVLRAGDGQRLALFQR